jgi:phosphatidylglycerol lysyltransferase
MPTQRTDTLGQVRGLVLRYGWNAMAYQILNPGIEHWLSPANDAVVGFTQCGRYRVVAGAPICAAERLAAITLEFVADTRRSGLRACFFGAERRLAATTAGRLALSAVQLGAQPVWQPAQLLETFRRKASLRAQLARAHNKQVRVKRWPTDKADGHPALRRCLAEWLSTRGLPPMGFLVEPDTLSMLIDRRVFVAERGGQVIGFLVASPVPLRDGWLIEQIVRGKDAPNGTAELLVEAAARELAGSAYLTLGLVPLSRNGREEHVPEPLWVRLLFAWVRAHGRRFYNFGGLEAFKAKFAPSHWEPIYALSSERRVSPRTLYAIASAFSGGAALPFLLGALGRALAQELRWLRR